jgi:hypothetical protein
MKDRAQKYTLPIDFEMAFTLADSGDWDSFELKNGRLVHNGFQEQIVGHIDALDEELLAKSLSIFKFLEKECMQVRVKCIGGEILCSKIIKGKKRSVSSATEIKNLISELVFKARSNGREVNYVEVVHTHLGRQSLTICDGKISQLKTHALSERDFKCIEEVKEFVDFPIKIKAITQEKMSYSKLVA